MASHQRLRSDKNTSVLLHALHAIRKSALTWPITVRRKQFITNGYLEHERVREQKRVTRYVFLSKKILR